MKRYLLLIVYVLIALLMLAQESVTLTLDDAIIRARRQSVNAAVALNELRQAYWEYRT